VSLRADAVKVLGGWRAPDEEQRALRDLYLAHVHTHPDALYRACRAGHITASAAVLDADGSRVLLTLHRKIGRWLQLGGHCEEGDATLAAAAAREATEESGITGLAMLPGPVNLDRHAVACGSASADGGTRGLVPGGLVPGGLVPGGLVPGGLVPGGLVPGGAGENRTWHLDVQYAAIAPHGARPVCGDESEALRWWPVDSLPPTADDSVRRLVARACARAAD
jgi:8-oxo-dGTP pyrophosphatase MutT (NUDIX family)